MLTSDALIADWKPDLIWDIFYLHVKGPLFTNNHAMSVLLNCGAAGYMIYRDRAMFISIFAALATASVHELMLAAIDQIFAYYQTVALFYGIYLGTFLVVALKWGTQYHRRVLLCQAVMMVGIYFVNNQLLWAGLLGTGSTVLGNQPTIDFLNPWTNFAEVWSWILPVSLWFLPKRWFNRQA